MLDAYLARLIGNYQGPGRGASRVEADVLHADDFLALMIGDGVPDGHVIGRQVQLVGAGQRVLEGERVREGRDRLVQ